MKIKLEEIDAWASERKLIVEVSAFTVHLHLGIITSSGNPRYTARATGRGALDAIQKVVALWEREHPEPQGESSC